jgi:putative flippase GtrA
MNLKSLTFLFSKFFSIGILATIVSLLFSTFLIEVLMVNPTISYLISYISSIVVSFFLNSSFVFKTNPNIIKYFSVYAFSMVCGTVLIDLLQSNFSFEPWFLPYLVLPFTTILNFLGSFFLLTRINYA